MTSEQCEAQLKLQLQSLYDAGEATAIANQVMEEYTGSNHLQRRLKAKQVLSENSLMQIQAAIDQLLQGKPLQYTLGYTEFYGLRFLVNESVLIPRPETEELVDWIIKDCKNKDSTLQILDIGTGSGCIPVALKKYLPEAAITTLDISNTTLETATQNALINEVSIQFLQLDFLQENTWQQLGKYTVIVSNPPYIPLQEKTAMGKNVTDWEPATALFVPDENPLLFYEKIALFGKQHLLPGGRIFVETHKDYATAVQQLFTQEGYCAELKKDMYGNERMVKVGHSVVDSQQESNRQNLNHP